MITKFRNWLLGALRRSVTVPISECVHFGAFPYGSRGYNPYESYLIRFSSNKESAREEFVEFLKFYRPQHMGELLGLELSRWYPNWCFPWTLRLGSSASAERAGWHTNPADCPDIITHFSPRGIPRARIEEEFRWLEDVHSSIRVNGYHENGTRPVIARRLEAPDGSKAYLLLDGNHRVAALSSLGVAKIRLRFTPLRTVRLKHLRTWPLVVRGFYQRDDAESIFCQYFRGNNKVRTTGVAAAILEGSP